MPRTEFSKELGLNEDQVSFVIQDLVTIGNAIFDTDNNMVCPTSESISQADTTIRRFFQAHDVYLRLTNEEADAKPVRFERLKKVVEESCRLGELGDFSKKRRTSNLLMYVWGVGLASQRGNSFLFHKEPVKDGRSIADASKFMHRRTKAYIFFGEAPPAVVIGCLQSLIENSLNRADAEKAHGKNAIHALVKFGLLAIDCSPIIPIEKSRYNLSQIVSESASQDEVISLVIRMLRDDPGVSNRFVGSRIGQIYKTNWVEKSKVRIGGAVLQWARWIERQKYGEKLNDAAWMKNKIRNLTNSTADRLFAMAVIVDEDTAAFRGRPKSLNAAATEAIRELCDDGAFTKAAIAKKLGLSRASIQRALASLRDRP